MDVTNINRIPEYLFHGSERLASGFIRQTVVHFHHKDTRITSL